MAKTFSRAEKVIEDYTIETFHPEDKVLLEIRKRAEKEGLPDIHVGPMDGLHLEVIARVAGAKKIVEIGILAGYSGVCLARALPEDGKLFCMEYDPKHAEVSRVSFEKAGLEKKVTILVGPALDNLPKIEKEGPFDLVFIDADKPSYPAYLNWAAQNLRVGGVVLGDNTFSGGRVADPANEKDPARGATVKAIRRFNRELATDTRFRTTIIPTGEGLTFGVKIAD